MYAYCSAEHVPVWRWYDHPYLDDYERNLVLDQQQYWFSNASCWRLAPGSSYDEHDIRGYGYGR